MYTGSSNRDAVYIWKKKGETQRAPSPQRNTGVGILSASMHLEMGISSTWKEAQRTHKEITTVAIVILGYNLTHSSITVLASI